MYAQKDKAINAINDAFSADVEDDDKVLFYLPVTKAWLRQFILGLVLNCHSSFRGVIKTLDDVFDYDMSVGTVHNVVSDAIQKATNINVNQDISLVTLGAHDELFHLNKPVLAGIDIPSLYCYLLKQEQHRDCDTWGIHVLDLVEQGFNPERVIADNAEGLRVGLKIACPHIPCDGDNFHITKMLIECRRYFRNRLKSSITYREAVQQKMVAAKLRGNTNKHSRKLGMAIRDEKHCQYLSKTIDTLVSWMEHDVLEKAGPNPTIRHELYHFIKNEFKKLEALYPHRIRAVRIALENQCDAILAFTDVLDNKFSTLANNHKYPKELMWRMCELQRYSKQSMLYYAKEKPLRKILKREFYCIERAVIAALDSTERTSSMVENFNSRLRPYLFLRREVGFDYLELLRFYLNHVKFQRSEKVERVGKTPTEIMAGKSHPHWLEMLGFERFKRAA